MALDVNKFKPIDWAIVATGGISFIALFLPWYGVSAGDFSASVSGWSTSYGWLGGLLVFAAAAWYFLWKAEVKLPELPVSNLVITAGVSALGFLIILLRWITLPRGSFGIVGHSYSYGGRAGIWIAAIVAATQVVVAIAVFRQAGEALPWKAVGTKTTSLSSSTPSVPPAPTMAPPVPPVPPTSTV